MSRKTRLSRIEANAKPDNDSGFICVFRDNGVYWREVPGEHDKLFITEEEYQALKRDNTIMLVLFDGLKPLNDNDGV